VEQIPMNEIGKGEFRAQRSNNNERMSTLYQADGADFNGKLKASFQRLDCNLVQEALPEHYCKSKLYLSQDSSNAKTILCHMASKSRDKKFQSKNRSQTC
jgi:hypothetical protein